MKKTTSKKFYVLAFTIAFVITLVSCRKDLNSGQENNAEGQSQTMMAEGDSKHGSSQGLITIPEILQVPAGNKLSLQVYAKGVQIWEVKRSTTNPTIITWVNIAPSAKLYRNPNFTDQLGTHYAGPTWEFQKERYSHKKVVAAKLQAVTVDVTAVPWLLLKAVDSLSSPNNKISYIQRISTTGGLAPVTGADEEHLGMQVSIPYTASYLFYEKKH